MGNVLPGKTDMKSKTTIRLVCIFLAGVLAGSTQAADWQSLFNGSDLDGWKQLGGDAKYKVEDGMIVGYTVPNSPNSFLTTRKQYSDFILEYETFVDPGMNPVDKAFG